MSPKPLLARTMFAFMVLAALFVFNGAAFGQDTTDNYLRLGCPVNAPLTAGSYIEVPVYMANSATLGGFTFGFTYNSDMIEIDSVLPGPAMNPEGSFKRTLNAAANTVLAGWISLDPAVFIDTHAPGAATEGLAFRLKFKVQSTVTDGCIDIQAAIIPPAGFPLFAFTEGTDVVPGYMDCGTEEIILGAGCAVVNNPPLALCQPVSVAAGANCTAAANINNGSNDPDSDPITIVQQPAGPYVLGQTLVSLIVTDDKGAADTCQAMVTVTDQTDPVVTCPSAIVVANTSGQCGANVNFAATATDNCDASVAITYSQNPNTFFGVGTTQVIATATDDAGNFSQCQFNVTVNDTQNPVAACPADVSVTAAPGQTSAVVNFVIPAASDNCPGVTSAALPASGSVFPLGTTPVTVTATDAHGNTNQCQFNVTVNAGNAEPVVSDIPDQVINQGESFATIALNDYVTDADDADGDITWTTQLMKSKGALTVSIDPVTHIATIVATPDFTGSAVFTFRATDPDGAFDEDQATFTVNALVNDPPVVSDIPNQTITSGASFVTISLDDFVVDPDNADAELVWTFAGNTQLGVAIDANRVATITYPGGFLGSEIITFTATDPGTLFDSDAATFTVNAVPNEPPVVSDIPDQTITAGASFTTISLDDFVADPDDADAEIVWTFAGNTQLVVVIDANRVATITYPGGFTGAETVAFTATDPGALFDSDAATFTVNPAVVPDFVVDATPEEITVESGIAVPFSYTVAVNQINGFEGLVLLNVTGLPVGATANFQVNPLLCPGSTGLTGTTSASTPSGTYQLAISGQATISGPVTHVDTVTLVVGNCVAPPIVVLDQDIFNIEIEEGSNPADEVVHVTNGAVCGTLYWEVTSDQPWVTPDPQSGSVDVGEIPGDAITMMFNTAELTAAGSPYTAHVQVMPVTVGKDRKADENGVITITLIVTEKPVSQDTVTVSHETAYPGDDVAVAVDFENFEELAGMSAGLTWSSSDVVLDSVSYVGSRIDYIGTTVNTINNIDRTLTLGALRIPPEPLVPVGEGRWVTLWFSVDNAASAGVISIDTLFIEPGVELVFNDEAANSIYPQFGAGSITILEIAENCISGTILDGNEDPVEGATVELWDETGVIATTTSNSDGYYEFCFMTPPDNGYAVRAYRSGFYPKTHDGVSLPDENVDIVLDDDAGEITPTYEWVDLYCEGGALFNDEPVAAGSVLEAFDEAGHICGRWVFSTPGTFGFMPVYHDDPYSDDYDEGCDNDSAIVLKLNGAAVELTGDALVWGEKGDRYEACFTAPAGGDVTKCIHLASDWNLVSFNVALPTSDLETLFAGVLDNTDVILSFEGSLPEPGQTYDPELPEFSTLFDVDNFHGYWFRMDAPDSICITGPLVAASTPIAIESNWNLVSYLPEMPMMVPNALISIWNSVVVVLGYDHGGLTYDPALPGLATLNEMKPCFGYWIKTNSAGTLVYPDGVNPPAKLVNSTPTAASLVSRVQTSNTWINLYGSNVKLDGETIPAGATIEAYNEQGTLVGEFSVRQSGKFGFMPIYGSDNFSNDNDAVVNAGKISFKINGQNIEQKIDWTSNGDRIAMSEFTTVGKAGGVLPDQFSLAQNYPNPFNPETSIEYVVAKPGLVEVAVFNVMGAKVKTLVSDYQAAGSYNVKWYGDSDNGVKVASGVYFYKMTAGDYTEIRKMTLLK